MRSGCVRPRPGRGSPRARPSRRGVGRASPPRACPGHRWRPLAPPPICRASAARIAWVSTKRSACRRTTSTAVTSDQRGHAASSSRRAVARRGAALGSSRLRRASADTSSTRVSVQTTTSGSSFSHRSTLTVDRSATRRGIRRRVPEPHQPDSRSRSRSLSTLPRRRGGRRFPSQAGGPRHRDGSDPGAGGAPGGRPQTVEASSRRPAGRRGRWAAPDPARGCFPRPARTLDSAKGGS